MPLCNWFCISRVTSRAAVKDGSGGGGKKYAAMVRARSPTAATARSARTHDVHERPRSASSESPASPASPSPRPLPDRWLCRRSSAGAGAMRPRPARGGPAPPPLLLLSLLFLGVESQYYGKELGRLSELHHGVRARVYAVDSRTLFLKDFHYDGEGPAAFFYVGSSAAVGGAGGGAGRLRDERGGAGPLRRYRGQDITLSLPEGKTFRDIKWFSVWCDEFSVNFGDVRVPADVEYPRPARAGALSGVHGVSSDPVVVVDAQTLLVPNFSYDGEAPDAKFWVGRGDKPSPQGLRIPDENGKETPLRRYDRKTIVLTLPGELTVFDIGHFGVWCEAFTVDFGHVALPAARLRNVPPSLKMLGVSPQSKLNCEVLQDELAFEVRWAVAGESIVLQLVAKLEEGEYMSFGLSGDGKRTQMVGGDVAVAWVDKQTLKGYAHDYYLDAKSQCAGVRGSCPDERLGEKTNSIRLLNAALVNGYSIVTYQRPLRAADELDRAVLTNQSQPVIWAIGPLNSRNEVSYHSHFTKSDKFIEFGRPPVWNCPMPETEEDHQKESAEDEPPVKNNNAEQKKTVIKASSVPTPKPTPKVKPWDIPSIQCNEPEDGVFYMQMGPTGGKQGYPAITGHVGWGISWYVNGLLIPEINVVRGKQYTFVVEGGSNPEVPARYHPFYISNDAVGGYYHKSDKEKDGIEIYAGVRRTRSGELIPTGVGRLCNWTPDAEGPEADEYPSFGAYQRSLTLVCDEGQPGVVYWTPDVNTPDTVYYQCFTHRHLGWKINVLDECETEASYSHIVESVAIPDDPQQDPLQAEESIQVSSRVKPDNNFIVDQRKKAERVINTKHTHNEYSSDEQRQSLPENLHDADALTGEVIFHQDSSKNGVNLGAIQHPEYELPISKVQIKQVIEAVENLETQMKDDLEKTLQPHALNKHKITYTDNIKDHFLPEQPIREDEEYSIESGKLPSSFMLPPNQKPLTLQSVMRPNGKPSGPMRPFRRPAPPEIKLNRPMFSKPGMGYPNYMPPYSGHMHPPKKHIYKHPNNRHSPGMNRPPNSMPPNKGLLPPHGQKPIFNNPPQKILSKLPNRPVQTVIMGKPLASTPTQTLDLGQTNIIGTHVVKSQITLPSNSEPIPQNSAPQIYFSKPGQIILGKPMENPMPLDQQMTQTKPQVMRLTPTPPPENHYPSTTLKIRSENEQQVYFQNELSSSKTDVKASDFMDESSNAPVTFQPAVNTGFKPDSIVIESGFKPIIREPLMASEDRITDFGDNTPNRREDTDIEEDYQESPQHISNHAYPGSEKLTQSFEPMFIPSPPDRMISTNVKTTEVFPSNHAKEDRPHPVYVNSESKLNALFSQQNMDKNISSDMVMEADRVSAHYLPPDPKLPKEQSQKLLVNEETFTTFDGKTVSAVTLTETNKNNSKLYSSKLPAPSEILLKTPQFGPYKGEIPPIIAEQLDKIPQVNKDIDKHNFYDKRTTHLKLINSLKKLDDDELKAEESELDEVKEKVEVDETEDDYDDDEYIRLKRDIKTATFQTRQVQETTTLVHNHIGNQVDFENLANVSPRNHCWTTHILLLVLLIRCF